ncbi:hypothetical protein Q1695_015471 [Nippostrongylus brasiliensis]|nr:hypothetical protein Q1695_015471 [Nippostrongylus brasiliensis]
MGICDLCNSEYPDGGDSKSIHESGRRHKRSLERQAQAAELPKKSVFVALIHKGGTGDVSVDYNTIATAFSVFGPVSHVSCGFLQDHAFVEFDNEDAVGQAIAAKTVRINESLTGVVYQRRITFHEEHDGPTVDVDEVIQQVSDPSCKGFVAQIDRIASCIGTTKQEISRRNILRKRFEELLRQFVQDPDVVQFGSAVTTVGTNDSDIDLCLLFKNDGASLMSDFIRDGETLKSCPPEDFREHPVHRDELTALSPKDQTEVLYRILKELRKEKSGFFKNLYVVYDARCPVIRFRSYDRHLVELSINNKIGCRKSAFIGALVGADDSGLLRKLVLALRFWAISNGVFSSEKKKTWNLNSYTLMLMFFAVLQSEKLLPDLSQRENGDSADEAPATFAFPAFSLTNVDFRKLLKKFFVLCVERPMDKLLFSMRNGGLVPLEGFKEQLVLKPQSVLFVQDPIEISDNVAKNVTIKALKTMRHAMMMSLAAMKQDADSFAVMLRVLKADPSSISPTPNMPPTEGSCRVSGFPDGFDDCMAETLLSSMLSSVLRCESVETPAKRPRFDCDVTDMGAFVVNKRLWMSRRTLRKKWAGVLRPDEQFPPIVEALVSASLEPKTSVDCSLQFNVFLDVHQDCLWVGLKLIAGELVDVANIAHFIEQMLTKTRDFLSGVGSDGAFMSAEEVASHVKKIFDRENSRINL